MSGGVFHAAALEIAVDARTAFDYVSDGLRQSDWTLGSTNRESLDGGLFRGTSAFDGQPTYVRIHAHPEQLLVDYEVGRSAEKLTRVNSVRIQDGPAIGRPAGTCVLALMKWRLPGETDEIWRRSTLTFDTEVHMIKGRLELGF